MQIRSLHGEDALEEEMATRSSILAWRTPWTEEPGGLVRGVAKSQTRLNARITAAGKYWFAQTGGRSSSNCNQLVCFQKQHPIKLLCCLLDFRSVKNVL